MSKPSSSQQEVQNVLNLGKSIPETIIRLSIPAILEQLLICMATLLDTAMVGSIGANATASVAINASTVWLINGIITALSVGFSYLVSHAVGERSKEKTELAVRQAITASVCLGLLLTLVLRLLHRNIPVWLGAEPDVVPNAGAYMGILAFGLLPQTLGVVLSAVLRSAGNTRLPLIANLTSNLLNVIGNFFLIYPSRQMVFAGVSVPVFGAGLGIRGAAISTAFSQFALAVLLLVFLFRADTPARIAPKGSYRFRSQTLKSIVHISVPVLLERNTLCLGQIALTAMISGLGTIPLAAHYLTNQTESLMYLPAYGFAYTATTLIGQSLGAGNRQLAARFAKSICIISAIVIELVCIPVFLLAKPIVSLLTTDAEVIRLGTQTVQIAAATELFFSFYIIISGIFRGAGDVKFPLVVSLVGMWGLRTGLVWLVTGPLALGVTGVWWAIGADCFIRFLLCLWRLKSGKWMK
ncbi:MAG: MATE family efflux transporter [Lachnospiraceae bacterium]|nr:MATE family efflux transporter [Lachnospiraceae bacterium]